MSLKMNFICLVVMFFVRVRGICKTDLTAAEQAFVDMHNELRRLHEDIPDLCFGESDHTHSFNSLEWANDLILSVVAATEHFNINHSGNAFTGENIYYQSTVNLTRPIDADLAAVLRWYVGEVKYWDFRTSALKRGLKLSDTIQTGHFTQIVWKNTKEVNCGSSAVAGRGTMVVCQYFPAGNVLAQEAEQVLPLLSGQEITLDEGLKMSSNVLKNAARKQGDLEIGFIESVKPEETDKPKEKSKPEENIKPTHSIPAIIFMAILFPLILIGMCVFWKSLKGRRDNRFLVQMHNDANQRLLAAN